MTTARKTACRPFSVMPWHRSTRRAYSVFALSLITRRIWSKADRWFVIVTLSIFSTFSRDISGSGCGGVTNILRLEFWKTISLLFDTFSLRLFAAAHVAILSISCWRVLALTDGTTRYVSSALGCLSCHQMHPQFTNSKIITVCTVVQNCCKGDSPCQWKTPIFRASEIKNPWTDRYIKLDRGNYVGDQSSPHTQTLVFLPLRGARVHIREIVIIRVYFFTPRCFFTSLLRTCSGRTVWPIFVVYGSKYVITRNLRPFRGANQKN